MHSTKKQNRVLDGRDILITGGTGSFGKKFVEIALREYNPRRIAIFSRDEMKHASMREISQFNDDRLRFFIGDVRDKERLYRALSGVDIVIHAAAMQIVSDTEYNPFETIKTNILGAQNLIECCVEHGVLRTIALSPDKAVNPANLYGATKLVSEKLFIDGNIYGNNTGVRFSSVRFGEIIGSRWNIVTDILKQAKKGVIELPDCGMTRFCITLEHAVHFVISLLECMVGGEIFVPKIPSFKVVDIADIIAPNIPINIANIRPGEKLHETLISTEEAFHTFEYDDYYAIYPQYPQWKLGTNGINVGKICEKGYSYSSDMSQNLVNKDKLVNYLEGITYQ